MGDVLYACGRWLNSPPPASSVVVDIFFTAAGEDTASAPSPDRLQQVRAAGGVVEYSFHLAAVRASMPTSAVPNLGQAFTFEARAVPDTARHDVAVLVAYNRAVRQSDLHAITTAGGRVTRQYQSVNLVAAQLPDAAVATLRRAEGVSYVEYDGTACAQG